MTIFYDNFWWQFWCQFFWTFLQLVTCDIWDTDYNTENWEPGFMTIYVTWQLIMTLDSIRNSCNVSDIYCQYICIAKLICIFYWIPSRQNTFSLSQVHIWGYKILLSQTVPKLFCFISRISSSPMGWDQMKKSLSEIFWSFPQSGRESFAERPLLIRIEFDSTRFVWIRSKEHFDKWYFCFWKADKSNWSGQMVRWSFGQRDRKRRTRCY